MREMEMESKKELLDQLMTEMDQYSAERSKSARETPKGEAVAVIEEKQVVPVSEAPKIIEEKLAKDPKIYTNKSRQNVLDEIEEQSVKSDRRDPAKQSMFRGYGRSRMRG